MTGKSLGQRILWRRTKDYIARYSPELIGIAGTWGTTLTEEAIALMLKDIRHIRAGHSACSTPIEVALSILGIQRTPSPAGWIKLLISSKAKELAETEPDTILLRLGANHPGDISWVSRQLPFSTGVLTNIGSNHLDYFTSRQMVAHEHESLAASLPPSGTAVLNIDEPLIAETKSRLKCRVITYGASPSADIRLLHSQRLGLRGFALQVSIHGRTCEISLPHIAGEHQMLSVLAAIAVADNVNKGKTLKPLLKNLTQLKPSPGCMQIITGKHQSTIIDDSFDAVPEDMSAALKTLRQLPARRKIAILGDMLSLGGQSIHYHTELGKKIAGCADIFVAVGQDMKHARASAMDSEHAIDTHHFPTSRDVGKWFEDYLKPGDLILIKGSRPMHMEKIVSRLQKTE